MKNLSQSRFSLAEIFNFARLHGVLQEMILLMALLLEDGRIFVDQGLRKRGVIHPAKPIREKWAGETQNDFVALISMMRECHVAVEHEPGAPINPFELNDWCQKHFVDLKKVSSAFRTAEEWYAQHWGDKENPFKERDYDPQSLMRVLMRCFPAHIYNVDSSELFYAQFHSISGDCMQLSTGSCALPLESYFIFGCGLNNFQDGDGTRSELDVVAIADMSEVGKVLFDAFPERCKANKCWSYGRLQDGQVYCQTIFHFEFGDQDPCLEVIFPAVDEKAARYLADYLWHQALTDDAQQCNEPLHTVLKRNADLVEAFATRSKASNEYGKLIDSRMREFYFNQLQGACSIEEAAQHLEDLALPPIDSDAFCTLFS